MNDGNLGKIYHDGEIIVRQGEMGDGMYVIQDGRVQILVEHDGKEHLIRQVGAGELIGEMAVFEHQVRSATVRTIGDVRMLSIDKRNFLRRISEDPSLAFHILQTMSRRIRELTEEVAQLKSAGDRQE